MLDITIPLLPPDLVPEASTAEYDAQARESVRKLESRYSNLIRVDSKLSRKTVSFQANKSIPFLRWYKYKEGFSGELVSRYLDEIEFPDSSILDPFAGSGTTLTRCAEAGFSCDGIELLPIGQLIIQTRLQLTTGNIENVLSRIEHWLEVNPWQSTSITDAIPSLRITNGAYPSDTERAISGYLHALKTESAVVKNVLTLVLMSILEPVSFTRKDGQYLRWDYRSGRTNLKSKFNKGHIVPFDEAIKSKLYDVVEDIKASQTLPISDTNFCRLHVGSCLDILPTMPGDSFGGVITSPPYCNRYDYTRTYALEHALLGVGEEATKRLRQAMLTCTVENRQKALTQTNKKWQEAIDACWAVDAFSDIVSALTLQAREGQLNNPNIARMIVGYFEEMACVIMELARVLKVGGKVVMVNDNVRYGGIDIPVDCILCDIAGSLGFRTIEISTLPRGKGNSSQQMGAHGRQELRKAVYIWEKV